MSASKSEYFVVRRGSTSLTNRVILSGLSYEALGLLLVELSLRPGTPLGYRQMIGRGAGRQRVQIAHKELEAAGFRHRFLTRTGTGALRTITVVSDESMLSREIFEEIDLPEDTYLVKIQTDGDPVLPKFEGPSVEGSGRQHHRAPETGARSEQGVSDSSTVRPVAGARSTEVRSTGARSTGARSTEARLAGAGRSLNTLRVKSPPPPPPEDAFEGAPTRLDAASPLGVEPGGSSGEGDSTEVDSPPAGFAADGLSGAGEGAQAAPSDGSVITPTGDTSKSAKRAVRPTQDDWNVITSALPASMRQGLPPREVVVLAELVRERLDAGWKLTSIRAVLNSRELPARVRYLPALLKARLEETVPIDSVPPQQNEPRDPAVGDVGLARMSAERRAAIDACDQCDHNGLVEAEGGLARCDHGVSGDASALAEPRF